MKAAIYRDVGEAAEVISVEEIETPEPGVGQVRVRVACSGVNPTDWKSRSGLTSAAPADFQVPHHDGAGVVDAVGPGAERLRVGERVWIARAAFENPYGTAAEYCVVPQERVMQLPGSASEELGACLGVPAVTAAHCLGGDPRMLEGANVLVAGGAGAVGHFAIELAKLAGAHVLTTVSSPEKAELARAAGADLVVDYRAPSAIDEVKAFAARVDRIVELALGANLELDLAVSAAGTVIAVYANEAADPALPTRRLMAANVALQYVLLYGVPEAQLAAEIAWVSEALAVGALSTLPLHRFPLERIVDAQNAVQQGIVGKVLVIPG